jgi:hypothetical protein
MSISRCYYTREYAKEFENVFSYYIQKEIVHSCARETLKSIREDIEDKYFAILVDEFSYVSHKEQLVIRYADRRGFVMERLIGVCHVTQTTSLALKEAIYSMLTYHKLSPSQIHGQRLRWC